MSEPLLETCIAISISSLAQPSPAQPSSAQPISIAWHRIATITPVRSAAAVPLRVRAQHVGVAHAAGVAQAVEAFDDLDGAFAA